MSCWTHLIFEAYCGWSFSKDKYVRYAEFLQDEKGKWIPDGKGWYKTKTLPKKRNSHYNPKHKRPNWCKRENKKLTPKPNCCYTKCPFLILDEVTKKEYLIMVKAWEKLNKKQN